MFSGGLRPYNLVLNRGCVNNLAFVTVSQADCNSPELPVSKTDKKLYLTCKTQPWDTDADDSDAVFKILGTIPDSTDEPNRVVFTISETQSYIDPTVPYFWDIVQTDTDGTNAERLAIGQFTVIAGANNEQAGGEA
jgi:hypothetical protein